MDGREWHDENGWHYEAPRVDPHADRLTLALLERQSVTRLRQIERALAELDAAIAALIASDEALARKAEVLCSIPGVSMVTAAAILAEMPELGTLEAATAASLTGPRALHARVRKVAGPGEDRRRAR